MAIAPEGLLKVIILERVDLDSLNEKLDTVMIRWDQLIDMGRGGMRSAVGSIVFNQWLGMANFCSCRTLWVPTLPLLFLFPFPFPSFPSDSKLA